MGLSELTNKELKNILRQNNIKNYSKLNKKDLTKKVKKLIGGDTLNHINTSTLTKELPPPQVELPLNIGKEVPSAPPYNSNEELNVLNNRKTKSVINESKSNQNLKKEECGACTIL